ncbi:MAG TPA: FUSC family protein [Opitutaceae bacterium]|nr:FUSC family protein [Opitutaceae bacterium]
MNRLVTQFSGYIQSHRLQPDLRRGLRCSVGFIVPLVAVMWWHMPVEAAFAATAAQNTTLVDIRGSYPLRLSVLVAMSVIMATYAWLGGLAAPSFTWSLAAVALGTLGSGAWRHLSTDYGPTLSVGSIFLMLLAIAEPGGAGLANEHFVSTLLGGLWGVLVQVCLWPFHAQHPLRRAVADTWLALSDVIVAMDPTAAVDVPTRHRNIAAAESTFRTTLNQTNATLATRTGHRAPVQKLEELNLAAARVATRLFALNSTLEVIMQRPDFAALAPSFGPAVASMTNTARGVAVTVVSRQPSHLAAADVRIKRLGNLLAGLRDRVLTHTNRSADGVQLATFIDQLAAQLDRALRALRETTERADERAAFSLELFDLQTWTMRPLASALNLRWPPTPVIVRFVLRLTVLELIGAAVMKSFALSRGYWLPLTVLVVLQPDYGSTRLKASQRFIGTMIGGLLASALLWLQLPPVLHVLALSATMFCFAFWVRRNYGIAVVFITLLVVLLTETASHVTIAFTLERMIATTIGGVLALIGAQLFWPMWERRLLRPIVARALQANRAYVEATMAALAEGRTFDAAVIAAKRESESANNVVFASLQRLYADPKNQQSGMETVAALANGNQRLTRGLNVIALNLGPSIRLENTATKEFTTVAVEALEMLAHTVDASAAGMNGSATTAENTDAAAGKAGAKVDAYGPLEEKLNKITLPFEEAKAHASADNVIAIYSQLSRAIAELSAMLRATNAALAENPEKTKDE